MTLSITMVVEAEMGAPLVIWYPALDSHSILAPDLNNQTIRDHIMHLADKVLD